MTPIEQSARKFSDDLKLGMDISAAKLVALTQTGLYHASFENGSMHLFQKFAPYKTAYFCALAIDDSVFRFEGWFGEGHGTPLGTEFMSAKEGLDVYKAQVHATDFESWLDDETASSPPGTYSTDVWVMTTVSVFARSEEEATKQIEDMIEGNFEVSMKPTDRFAPLPNNMEGLDVGTLMKADWNFSDF